MILNKIVWPNFLITCQYPYPRVMIKGPSIVRILYKISSIIYTRRFSNHESCLLSRSHTFIIIVILVQLLWLYMKECGQRSMTPKWPLTPLLLRAHVWLYPRIILSKSHENMSKVKVWGYSDPFFKNLNQRSLIPRWPLTPHLLRSHVWLNPRIIVSESHGNTSMHVDTVINFTKYHIHTTYILRTYIHTVLRTEWAIT